MTDQLVKRFVAPSMTRALELVQREMGPEAVILSSRRVDKGVEIVTSLEPDLPTRGIDIRREFGRNFDVELDTAMPSDLAWRSQAGIEKAAATYGGRAEVNHSHAGQSKPPAELAREIEIAREKMFAAKKQAQLEAEGLASALRSRPAQPRGENATPSRKAGTSADEGGGRIANGATATAADSAHFEQLQNDIADMRMLLEQQLWCLGEKSTGITGVSMPQQVSMPHHFSLLSERLARLGLSEPIIEELVLQVGQQTRASVAWRECMANLAKRIPICGKSILDAPGTYAFLGQTGVGKTTTIAKLAAQYVLRHGAGKVALVTTDTYRVGAFDQLRTMGRILNVPVRIVDGDNSLLTVLTSLRQFSLILIDTAGFRLGDPLLKAQLTQLESSPGIKRVLVLSCNSQLASMKASVHAHRGARGLYASVLTKVDESLSLGEAMSLVVSEQLPVAYTTDGQDIPHDISQARGHSIVARAVAILKQQLPGERAAAL